MNTVTMSFTTTVRNDQNVVVTNLFQQKLTKMSQRKKTG